MAGIGESLFLVSFCCMCTFLTAVSLSAIATNGAMKVNSALSTLKSVYLFDCKGQRRIICKGLCLDRQICVCGNFVMYIFGNVFADKG